MQDKSKTTRIVVCGVLLALCLILLCAVLIPSVYAKYFAKGELTGGSATVAKFDVSVTGAEEFTINLLDNPSADAPLYEESYPITVTNNSEVAVEYVVTVSFNTPLPSTVDCYMDENITGTGAWVGSRYEYVFTSDTFALEAGTNVVKTHNFTIKIPSGTNYDDAKAIAFSLREHRAVFYVTAAQKAVS